MVDKPDKELI